MKDRIGHIQNCIRQAALECGRDPASVRLIAVSKTVPAERIRQAIDAGLTVFGENYIQEARDKIDELASTGAAWHFIGHLQSNKAKYAVKLFDLIHTVDSIKLARELNKQAEKIDKVQPVLVQVNTGMETSKSGTAPQDAVALVREMAAFDRLDIRGLMTMPPFFGEPDKAAPYFAALRRIRDSIRQSGIPNVRMDELSMGMTGDFKVAIREGATLVRIGTAIFGTRQ